jgi:hypothetical protein
MAVGLMLALGPIAIGWLLSGDNNKASSSLLWPFHKDSTFSLVFHLSAGCLIAVLPVYQLVVTVLSAGPGA